VREAAFGFGLPSRDTKANYAHILNVHHTNPRGKRLKELLCPPNPHIEIQTLIVSIRWKIANIPCSAVQEMYESRRPAGSYRAGSTRRPSPFWPVHLGSISASSARRRIEGVKGGSGTLPMLEVTLITTVGSISRWI
jgi:hypothetical protein